MPPQGRCFAEIDALICGAALFRRAMSTRPEPVPYGLSREQTFHGSFWGNNTDLSEVMALAAENKIRHSIKLFTFNEINENLDLLRTGDIVGRAVMKF